MIQLRFVGFEHGLPCFLIQDEDCPFAVEISTKAQGADQVSTSRMEGGIHTFGFALGAHETICVEQDGSVVFVLHGEGVEP